jgi:hypothetical protein
MRTRLFVIALLVLAMATVTFAADDPFTGTWQRVPPKTGDNNQSQLNQLILKPASDGISIQQGASKPDIAHYGKDSLFQGGATWNIVRVNDHNLKSTASLDGKILINETATVSSDGKHYTRIQVMVGDARKSTIEYERVGPVPTGDAFFGTWQQILPKPKETGPLTYTIKIDGDTFDFSGSSGSSYKGKLDGKEYNHPEDGSTIQARRIDGQTIELSFRTTQGIAATQLWQLKGNNLTRTTRIGNAQGQGSVTEFERIK